jgi:hypothetical protein
VLPILIWNVPSSSLGPSTAILVGFLKRMLGNVGIYTKNDNSDLPLQSTPNTLEFRSGRLMVSV